MDKLDDLEWDQMMRDQQRQSERNFDRLMELQRSNGYQSQKKTPSNSEYIGPNSFIRKEDKILKKSDKDIFALSTSSITSIRDKVFFIRIIDESKIPRYDEAKKKEYIGNIVWFLVDCKKKQSGIAGYYSYDRNLNEVSTLEIPVQYIQFIPFDKVTSSSYLRPTIQYLCN
jgi:hypothetical protein